MNPGGAPQGIGCSHAPDQDFSAYGTLGQAYRDLGDLDRARQFGSIDLERARELRETGRVAAFLGDLAVIADREGDAERAGQIELDGLAAAADAGAADMWLAFVTRLVQRI